MKLLEPVVVGKTTLKNRIMFPPLTTGYEDRNGNITEQSRAFYERLAQGGVGYLVVGDVNPVRSFSPTPRLYEDDQIEGFRLLAEDVHRHGAKISAQIFHPEYDVQALAALFAAGDMGAVRKKMHHDMEHFADEATEDMLMEIIDQMVSCGIRIRKAGFDGIQIHGDRLAGALCSTKMNHRTDRFGGGLENRVRFARLLVQKMRQAVPDLILEYKLSIITPERGKGGIDLCDAAAFAKWLEEDGVDLLHVAQGNHTGNMADTIPPMGVQPYGFFVTIGAMIKEAVGIPVSVVGRIIDPVMAETILEEKKADIIALGRPLLCDPDWGNKLQQGKGETIRRCISCNKGCTDAIQNRSFLSCVLNAENGWEGKRVITPARKRKRVVIVGGGIAGLEAARVAALRGHQVDLCEKEDNVGGQIHLAAVPPRKGEILRAIEDLEQAASQAGAAIHKGCNLTAEQIAEKNPEVVLVAVGARNGVPPIPGADGNHVCDAWKILSGEQTVSGHTAVLGGGLVGCETAEFLAEQGITVSIVEMQDQIATGESVTVLPTMLASFDRYGVQIHTSTRVKEITREGLRCTDEEGKEWKLPCDSVILASGAQPNVFDTAVLQQAGIAVVRIGDCDGKATDIGTAIRSAYLAAYDI